MNSTDMRNTETYDKRGYLNGDFRLFHLTDVGKQEFEFHYHDFDKIIVFLSGQVTYLIEGRSYELKPYDVVMVRHSEIHRPLIDMTVPYERIIVYLSPGFLDSYRTAEYDLGSCFQDAGKTHPHVLRMREPDARTFLSSIRQLEQACKDDGYAAPLHRQLLFLEFLIQLNRTARRSNLDYPDTASSNQKILEIMDYINQNLEKPLDVDAVAKQAFLSRYHLMRLFRQETGYTLGHYITSKRLLAARELLNQDMPITEICYRCGFQNYSTFLRAYRKEFQETPRKTRNSLKTDGSRPLPG